jgi:hypothetical protein
MTRLFGGLLLGIGLLVMTCSGICSLVVIIAGFSEAMREPSVIMLPLLIGGVPFVIGLALFFWGRALLRNTNDRHPRSND